MSEPDSRTRIETLEHSETDLDVTAEKAGDDLVHLQLEDDLDLCSDELALIFGLGLC